MDDFAQTKIVDNQLFDIDGNLLGAFKQSFNQSVLGSVNSHKFGSEFTSSLGGAINYGNMLG
jgi:hypothetical protein